MDFGYILSIALLVFGFGFVIFWHELGHFLAAKWVGIRVEQFAVGFGQALLAWRKGIGFRVGTTTPEYERRIKAHVEEHQERLSPDANGEPTGEQAARAASALKLGETEYRLNWIPLGGYVKMLGQDDLNPNSTAEDPRAYNRKSIGARMIVVSAGVVMNVILAAVGFMAVFLMGFNVPPAEVGGIAPGSPAQEAGLRVGDEIWTYDGKRQHDWTKIQLNVALSDAGEPVPIEVKRREGAGEQLVKLQITPRRAQGDPKGFLELGIEAPHDLAGVRGAKKRIDDADAAELVAAESFAINPGDVITAVDGQPVSVRDYPTLDRAVQAAFGRDVRLTVKNGQGVERPVVVRPQFAAPFGGQPLNILGMVPRARVEGLQENSSARGKLKPGDAVAAVTVGTDKLDDPTVAKLTERLKAAGQAGRAVDLHVIRDGKALTLPGLMPNIALETGGRGLGIGLGLDGGHAVVADALAGSPAADLGIGTGARITQVNGSDVQSWYDVHRALAAAKAGDSVALKFTTKGGEAKSAQLTLAPEQAAAVRSIRYADRLPLAEPRVPRETDSPLVAAKWGVTETRDFILQFYVTLQRMIDGNVSPKNMMGPIGIFQHGTGFAYKGHDWLIWFLAMISANLAVVNFLPIPIVDGGLFTFLVLEKIKGRPLSARTQYVAQGVGLVVLLGVFVFVTYNDIARLTTLMR